MGNPQTVETTKAEEEVRQSMETVLKARCQALGVPVAIVGTQSAAVLLFNVLQNAQVPLAGIYEKSPHAAELQGLEVRPLETLSEVDPKTVVVVASSASSIELEDTLTRINSVFKGQVLCLEHLLDLPGLFQALKTSLDYKYGPHILDEWAKQMNEPPSHWPHVPDGFSVEGKTVLEFGPFEGHFSMMLMSQKPKRVIGLEGRPDNYAKVALLKAYLDWSNYTLRFGDMHLFPSLVPEALDVIFCSGVLYHSEKPWWLLKSCMEKCDTIILSGHVSSEHSKKPQRFQNVELENGTFEFEVFAEGGDNLSGLTPHSLWFKEEDLISFVNHHGFQYEKYREWVNPHGLWICSQLTRKK